MSVLGFKHSYIPLLRPASSFTLPQGIKWELTHAALNSGGARPDLPRAPYTYGIIAVSRKLTKAECEHFGLEPNTSLRVAHAQRQTPSHYRRGRFFVSEKTLTDGSKVYDVSSYDAAGIDSMVILNAETPEQAMNVVDGLFDALVKADVINP